MKEAQMALKPVEQLAYVEAVFDACWKTDYDDAVFWRPVGGTWHAFALCSDWFGWATADAEEILPEDIPLLRECVKDVLEVEREARNDKVSNAQDSVATAYFPELFASRKRQLRPMRAVYEDEKAIGPRLIALFDAAGPPREDPEGKRSDKPKVYDQEAEEAP